MARRGIRDGASQPGRAAGSCLGLEILGSGACLPSSAHAAGHSAGRARGTGSCVTGAMAACSPLGTGAAAAAVLPPHMAARRLCRKRRAALGRRCRSDPTSRSCSASRSRSSRRCLASSSIIHVLMTCSQGWAEGRTRTVGGERGSPEQGPARVRGEPAVLSAVVRACPFSTCLDRTDSGRFASHGRITAKTVDGFHEVAEGAGSVTAQETLRKSGLTYPVARWRTLDGRSAARRARWRTSATTSQWAANGRLCTDSGHVH